MFKKWQHFGVFFNQAPPLVVHSKASLLFIYSRFMLDMEREREGERERDRKSEWRLRERERESERERRVYSMEVRYLRTNV
jgi:hypothetical protein